MTKKLRIVLLVVLAALMAVGIWVVVVLPNAQDVQASAAMLTIPICEFIKSNGRMPNDLSELTTQGLLRRLSGGSYECVSIGKIINRIDDVHVEWRLDKNICILVQDELASRETGDKYYIIRPKRFRLPGEGKVAMNLSVIIYHELMGLSLTPRASP